MPKPIVMNDRLSQFGLLRCDRLLVGLEDAEAKNPGEIDHRGFLNVRKYAPQPAADAKLKISRAAVR